MVAYRGSRGIALLIFYPRHYMGVSGKLYTRAALPSGKNRGDVLNHNLLLEKLLYYDIRDCTNLWFRSYLFCRKQFI